MDKFAYQRKGYLISALLGAVGGGIVVMVASRAIPIMMSRMMAGMMQNMMSQMKASGHNPQDM